MPPVLTVPVLCGDNGSSHYDGKTWSENIRHIVEHNGKAVDFTESSDQDLPTFEHGDAVIIKYRRKGGKFSYFKGTVNLQAQESAKDSAKDQGAVPIFTSVGCSASTPPRKERKRARPAEKPKCAKRARKVGKYTLRVCSIVLFLLFS